MTKYKQPKCGCIININCSKHKTTEAMYEALKEATDYLYALGGNEKLIPPEVYLRIKGIYLRGYESLALAEEVEK